MAMSTVASVFLCISFFLILIVVVSSPESYTSFYEDIFTRDDDPATGDRGPVFFTHKELLPFRRGLVVSSPPATDETGAMGREIESGQGIGRPGKRPTSLCVTRQH
jgi:hypothetical protein